LWRGPGGNTKKGGKKLGLANRASVQKGPSADGNRKTTILRRSKRTIRWRSKRKVQTASRGGKTREWGVQNAHAGLGDLA